MDKRQLTITAGVVLLGLLLAFPLKWIFVPASSPSKQSIVRGLRTPSWLNQTDENGTQWTLTQASGLPAPKDANGVQAKPVIVVKTDVFRAGRQEVLIGLVLAGREGQTYHPSVLKGGARLPAPKLRIVDEAGKVLLDDSFKYG